MNITFEERQLMSLYNTGTRTGLIAALEEMRGYLAADETELRELTDSAIAKLRRMSDAEYDALDLFPDFEKEDTWMASNGIWELSYPLRRLQHRLAILIILEIVFHP